MNIHDILDELKRVNATIVLHTTDMAVIRAKSLANLDRWNANGAWCSAHDEWRKMMSRGCDVEIVQAMTGTDQTSNRLRQSAPYAGLLDQDLRRELWYKYYPSAD